MSRSRRPGVAPLPRAAAAVRIALLAVLVGALLVSAFTDGIEWLTFVMAACAISLGGFRLWDIWGTSLDQPTRPSPLGRLWQRTDRGDDREHTGDWW